MWKETNINQEIQDRREKDTQFREAWDSSREEYRILGELTKMRKDKGISQNALAEKIGIKQQVISRVEKRENSPTLKILCSMLDALGYRLAIVPKSDSQTDKKSVLA